METITHEQLKELQKALDQGGPVAREYVLALYRHHIIREARLAKLAQILLDSDNERLRSAGRLVAALMEQ